MNEARLWRNAADLGHARAVMPLSRRVPLAPFQLLLCPNYLLQVAIDDDGEG